MKIRKSWISLIATGAFAGFMMAGCSDANVSPVTDQFASEATTTYAMVAAPMEFEDATVQNEARETPNPNLDPKGRKPMPHPFSRLLKALNLTEDQALQVRGFLGEHDTCVREAMLLLRQHQHDILDAAKAARRAVLDSLKEGLITREEAAASIRSINHRARMALKESSTRERVREILQGCDNKFLRQLASILTDDQMVILKRFLEAHDSAEAGGRKG